MTSKCTSVQLHLHLQILWKPLSPFSFFLAMYPSASIEFLLKFLQGTRIIVPNFGYFGGLCSTYRGAVVQKNKKIELIGGRFSEVLRGEMCVFIIWKILSLNYHPIPPMNSIQKSSKMQKKKKWGGDLWHHPLGDREWEEGEY